MKIGFFVMKNKGVIFASFFFSSLFIIPASACQPEAAYPYLIELEDEEHSYISQMEFEPVPKSDKVLAKLELIDSTRFDWLISSNDWSFCASKQQGSYISLGPFQLEKIILFNPPPSSPSI